MRCYKSYYSSSIVLSLLLVPILNSEGFTLPNSCQTEYCGNIKIPYPFGIEKGCYLNEWYKIVCKNDTSPFLSKIGMEVVKISLPGEGQRFYSTTSYGSIRVKSPVASVGCSKDGKESNSVLNLMGSPYFFGRRNILVAVGCNSKSTLTYIEPRIAGCELDCTKNKKVEGVRYCEAGIPGGDQTRQVIGVKIESSDNGNGGGGCRVAFLTDENYAPSNATKPVTQGYSIVMLEWLIEKNNLSSVNSLSCINRERVQ